LPLFDHVVAVRSAESGSGKAEAVRDIIALDDYETALWIGDTEIDIIAARQLGVKVCVVECGLRTAEYLATFAPEYCVPGIQAIV
jgi:phosphoglycolate phosphatase-like HAD superfamily hydrolase